jgi:hypothetical protein
LVTTATRFNLVLVTLNVTILIEILVTKDCPGEDAALRLVAMAAQITGVAPQVMLVELADLAETRRTAFPGSPTIRVNGRDIAPASNPDPASLGCRDYQTDHGNSDIPALPQLLAAITDTPPPERVGLGRTAGVGFEPTSDLDDHCRLSDGAGLVLGDGLRVVSDGPSDRRPAFCRASWRVSYFINGH